MYDVVIDDSYIDLGEYNDIHSNIKKFALEIFDKKIEKLYEFMRENLYLLPYIINFTMEDTDLLSYPKLFGYELEDNILKKKIYDLLLESLKYTMDNDSCEADLKSKASNHLILDIENDPTYKNLLVKIYEKLLANTDYIYNTLKKIDKEYDFNNYIARQLLKDKIAYKELRVIQSSWPSNNNGYLSSQILPFTEYYDYNMKYTRNLYLKSLINSIKKTMCTIYNNTLNKDSNIDAIRNKFALMGMAPKFADHTTINTIYMNFYFWNYILIDNELYILQLLYNNHFYLKHISKEHPFGIRDYYYSYILCFYDDETIKDFAEKIGIFNNKEKILTSKGNMVDFYLSHFNSYINFTTEKNYELLCLMQFNEYFRTIADTILEISEKYNNISIRDIAVICKNDGVFDENNDFEVMLYVNSYNDNESNKLPTCRNRYILSTKIDSKPKLIGINSETRNKSFLNGKYTNVINVIDDVDDMVINSIHREFIAQKNIMIDSYKKAIEKFNKEIADKYPDITFDGDLNKFIIEFKYYYEMLNPNHKYLYNDEWSENK